MSFFNFFLFLFELLFLVERLADQRRDLLALMKLLNFGAGSDSTAGLATHGLQQANTQSTVRVDKYGECAYGECFTRTTQQRQLKKEVYIQGQISRVVSHSQRILSQRKHHLLIDGRVIFTTGRVVLIL